MFTTEVFIAAPLFPTDAALTGFILQLAVFKESTGINVLKHFFATNFGGWDKKDGVFVPTMFFTTVLFF
jgi:hypothetical protein